jgi:hypothetical protein
MLTPGLGSRPNACRPFPPYFLVSASAGDALAIGGTMAQQSMASTTLRGKTRADGLGSITVPGYAVRFAGAMLALAVTTVHVADQGGVGGFNSPDWIGWSYRLIEVGGVLTALVLLLPRPSRLIPAWAGWAAGVLLGVGPFVAYVLSRTVGVPGDPGDVGNWGYWVGTVSLLVEAALVTLSVSMLLALSQRTLGDALRGLVGRARPGA